MTLVASEQQARSRYYLVFKAESSVDIGGGDFDGIGLVVEPDVENPIQWFRLIIPQDNGVEWLQIRASEAEGNPRFELIAPETVKDWPGLWGDTAK